MKKASMKNVFDFRNFQLTSKSKRNILGGIDYNQSSNSYNELLDDDLNCDPTDPNWGGPKSTGASSTITFGTLNNEILVPTTPTTSN